ncbi:MAG: hypothetical protein A3D74_00960 [Candidatus Levybacteria bacterium RIFCSPHIGHO2_02_FULL_37_13]|nr:MAG: hypothetical protein A3D74_00960 [Candidatus Levybacteria bacterium RIFCSPHIGHO2_02_FULL_37_13]OGH29360.1 MAG: hypothetical protein A3E40_00740 [Candidatus Levybacteria bacterium RIFCSPHIGHO2_12_FULL_37_9]OGH39360.1 MAG: hypothetical protein A3B41_03080 [Candidatus Levybacteria bacterium RIFCSPLOWO2_01_FULL_37_26]
MQRTKGAGVMNAPLAMRALAVSSSTQPTKVTVSGSNTTGPKKNAEWADASLGVNTATATTNNKATTTPTNVLIIFFTSLQKTTFRAVGIKMVRN